MDTFDFTEALRDVVAVAAEEGGRPALHEVAGAEVSWVEADGTFLVETRHDGAFRVSVEKVSDEGFVRDEEP